MFAFAPHLALTFNAFIWGLSWLPFQAMHQAGLAAPWATALMYAVLLLGLTLLAPGAWRTVVAQPGLWLLGCMAGMTNMAFNTAVSTGDVVRVILLFYLMPAWTILLAWRLLGERPTLQGLVRLALAFSGMALVIVPAGSSWESLTAGVSVSDLLALLGGMSFALCNVLLRRTAAAPAKARMLAMFSGSLVLSVAGAVLGMWLGVVDAFPAPNATWILWAASMAVILAVANFSLQFGAGRLPTATSSLIMLSEVLIATVSAWLMGATALTPRMLVGGALIIAGALMAALQAKEA